MNLLLFLFYRKSPATAFERKDENPSPRRGGCTEGQSSGSFCMPGTRLGTCLQFRPSLNVKADIHVHFSTD